jgi:serine/threonine protein kinase
MGLLVCHRSKVLHRDIKADNIYISKGNIAKLGDFGASRSLSSTVDMSRTMAGTPYIIFFFYLYFILRYYMSPEILRGDPFAIFHIFFTD